MRSFRTEYNFLRRPWSLIGGNLTHKDHAFLFLADQIIYSGSRKETKLSESIYAYKFRAKRNISRSTASVSTYPLNNFIYILYMY